MRLYRAPHWPSCAIVAAATALLLAGCAPDSASSHRVDGRRIAEESAFHRMTLLHDPRGPFPPLAATP
jgi:hypothetical protein